jgi:hypothetical protein
VRTGAQRALWALLCLAAILALFAGGIARADDAQHGPPHDPPHDPRVTSIAQLLAGVEPEYALHARLAALDAWRAHARTLTPQWRKLRSGRLSAIEAWRDQALIRDVPKCRTLLYPFSGPDFLNAYLLFPLCDAYVFVGLEPPGSLPDLDRMSEADVARTLRDMRAALQDLLAHNFFMTKHMAEQLDTPHVNGVVPPLAASMGLIRIRIIAVEPLALPAARAGRKPTVRGTKITFFHPDVGRSQALYYLAADASNAGFDRAPELAAFLLALKPATVLVKSGSYLLHRSYFSRLRDTVLDIAELVVQDDTGIPYRLLRSRGWEVHLYGDYTGPIPLFAADRQPDLAVAYRNRPGQQRLPFAFGYKGVHGESNAMVARTEYR